MRTASIAKLSLTALVGLGSLIGSANLAEAGPAPQGGTIKVAPTTPTTAKPLPGDKVAVPTPTTVKPLPGDKVAIPTPTTVKPLSADEVGYCDLHLCLPADEVDPEPECNLNPVLCDHPVDDKVNSPGCKLTHGCPDEDVDGGTDGGGGTGGTDGDEPCRSDLDARTSCEGDGGTDGGTDGEQGTDGQADGGTTGGGGGRLPKTGGSLMALLGGGLGLTGIGAVIKRATRRRSA